MGPKLFLVPVVALIVWQIGVIVAEYFLRWRRYRLALAVARARGKPLLVVGRPGGSIRIYGCGDVTMDINSKVLTDCPKGGVVADVRKIPFSDKYFGAAFCSHVLNVQERPEDATQGYQELQRVADRVFVCYTSPFNLFWRFLSGETRIWLTERDGRLYAHKRPW